MSLLKLLRYPAALFLMAQPFLAVAADPPAGGGQKGISLLSNICKTEKLQGTGIDLFIEFFNCVWPWILSVAGGVAVLQGVIGGTMIMLAGDDSGRRGEGINKLKFSILGLILVAFMGTILRVLNPSFYK